MEYVAMERDQGMCIGFSQSVSCGCGSQEDIIL